MHRVLGLSRDPFASVCDGDLYWENTARAEVRAAAGDLLRQGQGVWLSGPRGSGRSVLLERIAEDLAAEGRPVLDAAAVSPSAETFLADLLEIAGDPESADHGTVGVAASLYARLVEVFADRGPVLCFPGPVSASPEVVAELEILGALRLLNRPLVALALAGAGESPLPGLRTVKLPPVSPRDLRDVLAHRLAGCGGSGLVSPDVLEGIAERAHDLDEALALGRRILSRHAFRRCPATQVPERSFASLFRPAELDEVARLLDSLGPQPTGG